MLQKRRKIFIVEDDRTLRSFFIKCLNSYGFDIVGSAKDGKEAIEQFKIFSRETDIVLIDYHIPFKNGCEVVKEILQIDKTVKIIIMSGDETINPKIKDISTISFFDKHSTLQDLKKIIESL